MSERESHLDLSWPTVVGGAVAAATATFLAGRMGLVGTVVGAGVASVLTTVVAAIVVGWIEHVRGAGQRRKRLPWRGLLIGGVAVTLVVLAFVTGLELLREGLPQEAVAKVLDRLSLN